MGGFTSKTIALSQCAPDGIDIRRDFEFAYVGKIPTRLDPRLVAASEERHFAELEHFDGVAGVITTGDLVQFVPEQMGLAVAEAPYHAALDIHEHVAAMPGFQWQDFDTRIDEGARIHPTATIADRNVIIGPRCRIDANVVVHERTQLGTEVCIGAGTIIGCEAFDSKPGARPARLLRQSGGVSIENNVTIGCLSTIARASFGGYTTVGAECLIDNQVYIAHDCAIGQRTTLTAGVAIMGRVSVGEGVYVGPNATISNGLSVGGGAIVSLGSVVTQDVPEGTRVSGNFAVPHDEWLHFVKGLR